MTIKVTGSKADIERKIRIIEKCIKIDIAKKDYKSLHNHKLALVAHQEELKKHLVDGNQ